MSEKITMDGKDYEVLTLDRIGEITHARLAGELFTAELYGVKHIIVDGDVYTERMQKHNNIQPLKLIERKPVEFSVEFAMIGSHWYPLHTLDDAQGSDNNKKMKFKCVQITEEA